MTAGKVRAAVVADKTEVVTRMLAGITILPLASEADFLADARMVAAGESYLRRALEALFDLGRHLLAKGYATAGIEYKEIAQRLGEYGVLPPEQAALMVQMAGYRNRLVHFYDEVTPAELYQILTVRRGDVLSLLGALQAWVAGHPELVEHEL